MQSAAVQRYDSLPGVLPLSSLGMKNTDGVLFPDSDSRNGSEQASFPLDCALKQPKMQAQNSSCSEDSNISANEELVLSQAADATNGVANEGKDEESEIVKQNSHLEEEQQRQQQVNRDRSLHAYTYVEGCYDQDQRGSYCTNEGVEKTTKLNFVDDNKEQDVGLVQKGSNPLECSEQPLQPFKLERNGIVNKEDNKQQDKTSNVKQELSEGIQNGSSTVGVTHEHKDISNSDSGSVVRMDDEDGVNKSSALFAFNPEANEFAVSVDTSEYLSSSDMTEFRLNPEASEFTYNDSAPSQKRSILNTIASRPDRNTFSPTLPIAYDSQIFPIPFAGASSGHQTPRSIDASSEGHFYPNTEYQRHPHPMYPQGPPQPYSYGPMPSPYIMPQGPYGYVPMQPQNPYMHNRSDSYPGPRRFRRQGKNYGRQAYYNPNQAPHPQGYYQRYPKYQQQAYYPIPYPYEMMRQPYVPIPMGVPPQGYMLTPNTPYNEPFGIQCGVQCINMPTMGNMPYPPHAYPPHSQYQGQRRRQYAGPPPPPIERKHSVTQETEIINKQIQQQIEANAVSNSDIVEREDEIKSDSLQVQQGGEDNGAKEGKSDVVLDQTIQKSLANEGGLPWSQQSCDLDMAQ